MNRLSVTTAVLIFASFLTLTGCSEDDSATEAGSAPAAATTPSSAPPPPAASDKELCESAKQAGEDMKKELVAVIASGEEPSPAQFKKILGNMNEKMTTLSAQADSEVAAAMKAFGAEAGKSAEAADPAGAAENPAFEKAGAGVTAACKPTGVDVNF